MNENINLCEILKGHEGETFYNPLLGNIKLAYITDEYIVFSYNLDLDELFIKHNGNSKNTDELAVFPSKDQRDWNKWIEEQKSKVPKTWDELIEQNKCECYILGKGIGEVDFSSKGITPIEKSALSLLKIHQLIEVGYGGNISNEEWRNLDDYKFRLLWSIEDGRFIADSCRWNIHPIAFHTKEQAEEFLNYPENVQLLKDYFMMP